MGSINQDEGPISSAEGLGIVTLATDLALTQGRNTTIGPVRLNSAASRGRALLTWTGNINAAVRFRPLDANGSFLEDAAPPANLCGVPGSLAVSLNPDVLQQAAQAQVDVQMLGGDGTISIVLALAYKFG